MKFRTKEDAELFCIEIGLFDLVGRVNESYEPTSEQYEAYLKRRHEIVPSLKSFRRSSAQSSNWRHNRYKIMRGIKNFARSTEGKRFHRVLGNFIANRIFRPHESYDKFELLKAISSLKTHLFIEGDYYMPLNEYVDYELVVEEFIPELCRMEEELVLGKELTDEELDLLIRFCSTKQLGEHFKLDGFDNCIEKVGGVLEILKDNNLNY